MNLDERIARALWLEPNEDAALGPRWPPYLSNRDLIDGLEIWIERRGLTASYTAMLCDELGIDWKDAWQQGGRLAHIWTIIRATPKQRAQAFLKVINP